MKDIGPPAHEFVGQRGQPTGIPLFEIQGIQKDIKIAANFVFGQETLGRTGKEFAE